MTRQSDKSDGRVVSFRLRGETVDRIDELAREAGVRRATILADILEELVPKIATVQRRTAIQLKKADS